MANWVPAPMPGAPPPPAVLVLRNRFADNVGTPLSVTGTATVRANLFERNNNGVSVSGGPAVVEFNTFVRTGTDYSPALRLFASAIQSTDIKVAGNTFVPRTMNSGAPGATPTAALDVSFWSSMAATVDLSGNYWGTTDRAAVEARIRDGADDLSNKGVVAFEPVLTAPSASAPAIAESLTMTPESPVGIQTVTFRATFSGPMDPALVPTAALTMAARESWTAWTSENSVLRHNDIHFMAIDGVTGLPWASNFGNIEKKLGWPVSYFFDGASWREFRYEGAQPTDNILGLAADADGTKWMIVAPENNWQNGSAILEIRTETTVRHLCGVSTFPCGRMMVHGIAVDRAGVKWFSLWRPAGLVAFDGRAWRVFDLPEQLSVFSIAPAPNGDIWTGVSNDATSGVCRLRAGAVQCFSREAMGFVDDRPVNGQTWVSVGPDGQVWVLFEQGTSATFDGVAWRRNVTPGGSDVAVDSQGRVWGIEVNRLWRYDGVTTTSVEVPGGNCMGARRLVIDHWDRKWVGRFCGVSMLGSDRTYPVPPGRWIDDRTWETTYDVTSLMLKGDYVLTVSGARDQLGFDTPAATTTFTVDYAGTITDRTPPVAPVMIAAGKAGDAGAVEARWAAPTTTAVLPPLGSAVRAAATDPSVTGYRYAIGTAAGATDVVNWTDTTATAVSLSGLGLIPGQQYYLTLQARNAGGLWSASTISPFVAGTGFRTGYLAEGATGDFFDLDIALANPATTPVSAFVTFLSDGGASETLSYVVPAQGRITVRADEVAAVAATAVSTVVESAQPLIVERTMFWNPQDPTTPNYGGHGGHPPGPARRGWAFPYGSPGVFDTRGLVSTPPGTDVTATVTFLLDAGRPPLEVPVLVPARQRETVFAGAYPRLVNTSFAITVTAPEPVLAERAMYFGGPPRWRGGHESPGTTTLATR